MTNDALYDVVVVGGGPTGLQATLTLARARKRVLLCDSGPRRNAAATHVHNFVTRDGTPPEELRRVAREQLAHYPNVRVVDARVEAITGSKGAFDVTLSNEKVRARRIVLATGMIDEMLPIEGFAALWGTSIFQCPYCHGWEVQDRRWGFLARDPHAPHAMLFAIKLRAWTRDVAVFTDGVELDEEARARLAAAGVRLVTAKVARLEAREGQLASVALEDGTTVPCEALFVHPRQHQVELVRALDLALDDDGLVRTDPMTRETSVPGIYAAGDLASRMQAAIAGAAAAMQAAAMINTELTNELARSEAR